MRSSAYGTARGFGLSEADAEDVAQDAMLKLWSMHEQLDAAAQHERLAAVMSRRLCIDRGRTTHQALEMKDAMMVYADSDQHDRLECQELERWLEERIAALPETNRIILQMRQIENRELDEIAQLLGIGKSSVSTLLSRARRQLLEDLKRRNRQ